MGRAGIMTLSLAAIDVALWDLKAKSAGVPLWKLLGGQVRPRVRAYNTDIGWLSIGDVQLVDGARRAVDDGFTGIKIKVGSSVDRDLRRIEAVREAIGLSVTLAIDGNGKWEISATCLRFCCGAEPFDRPSGSRSLCGTTMSRATWRWPAPSASRSRSASSFYTADAFSEFFAQQVIHWVQPDVTRMGGITEALQVRQTAHSFRLPVAPHAGDMSQVYVHLSHVYPACEVLEYIPWIKDLLHRAGRGRRWPLPPAAAAGRGHDADRGRLAVVLGSRWHDGRASRPVRRLSLVRRDAGVPALSRRRMGPAGHRRPAPVREDLPRRLPVRPVAG